ncbi:MAG: hypothetical protein ACRCVA_27975 [Phreatobacter sp.]
MTTVFGIPVPSFAGQVLLAWLNASFEALGLSIAAAFSLGSAAIVLAVAVLIAGLVALRRRASEGS